MQLQRIAGTALLVSLAACGGGEPGAGPATVRVDGSSTVFPITEAVAEEFQRSHPDVRVTVGISGTGGGFKKFVLGETDINDASRTIKGSEEEAAQQAGVGYIELPVAFDGLSVVVNPDNSWVDHLTVAELNAIWNPESTVRLWSDVRSSWPSEEIGLYGPGTDSGTFDYFTETVNGESGASRADFTASEDDNVLVQGVAGDINALAFFGYAYYAENQSRLKLVPIDGGDGSVLPSEVTINDGTHLRQHGRGRAARDPGVRAVLPGERPHVGLGGRVCAAAGRGVCTGASAVRVAGVGVGVRWRHEGQDARGDHGRMMRRGASFDDTHGIQTLGEFTMKIHVVWRAVAVAIAAIVMGSSTIDAQVEVRSRAMQITLTGRVHAQFDHTSVEAEPASEFLMRRVRFSADVRVNDLVSGRVQPDYGDGKLSLKDAWVRLNFAPQFRATVGQFKRPFDLFELTSSTQILVIERAGGVRGVDACAGPGGTCSFSRLTEKLQYADRDIGVQFSGASGSFGYAASVTNGTGANTADENGAKSYTGRVTVSPLANLEIGANVAAHDYLDNGGVTETAIAFGGDVEFGSFGQGFHAQAGFVTGDNWRNLGASGPSKFMAAQGIVTYKLPMAENPFVSHVEPVARVSYADPDRDLDADQGWLFTPGFVVHFTGRNKIAANIDVWSPATGDTEWSLRVQTYLHF
jgi:phosphate transport system substrate-binding protein